MCQVTFVIFQEYGITREEKMSISMSVCNHFYRKIQADLQYNVHQLEETVHRLDPRYYCLQYFQCNVAFYFVPVSFSLI